MFTEKKVELSLFIKSNLNYGEKLNSVMCNYFVITNVATVMKSV